MIIGYESALQYWRSARTAEAPAEDVPEGKVFGMRRLSLTERTRRALDRCNAKPPLDVVVPSKQARHTSPLIADHVWRGPLTDRQLFGLGDDLFVCRMPPVLCQLAVARDVLDVAEIAYELTGAYGLTDQEAEGFASGLAPLTDVAELRGYAMTARALGIRGASRALEALDLVIGGSASPRETSVAIFFSTSRVRGGADVCGFTMNRRIELPARLAERVGQKVVVPDFSWGNGTMVEYDSDQEHQSPDARARDEAKRLAYRAEGLDCLTLTNGMLRSNDRLELFVQDLERSLGLRRRPSNSRMDERRRLLRERLFGTETTNAALAALNDA